MKFMLGRHTIRTVPDASVVPGHQQIAVAPADIEGAAILCALTGNRSVMFATETRLHDGSSALVAPHDESADERLMQLVDLCADLRFSAPDMLQLRIEGFDDD